MAIIPSHSRPNTNAIIRAAAVPTDWHGTDDPCRMRTASRSITPESRLLSPHEVMPQKANRPAPTAAQLLLPPAERSHPVRCAVPSRQRTFSVVLSISPP